MKLVVENKIRRVIDKFHRHCIWLLRIGKIIHYGRRRETTRNDTSSITEHIFLLQCVVGADNQAIWGELYRIKQGSNIDGKKRKRERMFQSGNNFHFNNQENMEKEHNFKKSDNQGQVFVWVSFVEIYNERLKDLLVTDRGETMDLKIHPTERHKTTIKNLRSVAVVNYSEARHLFRIGLTNRVTSSTQLNSSSSRSHSVFLIDVIEVQGATKKCTQYRFCDLAGAEQAKISEASGHQLQEAKAINSSLTVLGRCFKTSLANQVLKRKELLPCRESKITLLLQSPLKGFQTMVILVNVWLDAKRNEENINVIRHSSVAKKIVHRSVQPAPTSRSGRYSEYFSLAESISEGSVSEFLDENFGLKEEIAELREQLEEKELENVNLRAIAANNDRARMELEQVSKQDLDRLTKTYSADFQRFETIIKQKDEKIAQVRALLETDV